jgi:predicted membrane chloride channel (bestrophin family)
MGTIRNLARQVWISIPEKTKKDHNEKMRCVKLLLAYFVATKRHLRHEYGIKYDDCKVSIFSLTFVKDSFFLGSTTTVTSQMEACERSSRRNEEYNARQIIH